MNGKHMFAGVNAPQGFFSRFDNIMPDSVQGRKIFIKGGPGMGKSTFMKKIAEKAKELDLEYEVFHCSSDPASLDGVYIPSLQTAVVDATAPHGSDPVYPVVGGELFDVSVFADKEKIAEHSGELQFYTAKKKRAFARGYHYLKAALPLLEDMEREYRAAADLRGIYDIGEKLANRILGQSSCEENGAVRKLFVSAITPEGFINYVDGAFADAYVVTIKGAYGGHIVLKRFAELAFSRGFTPILFYCPMRPSEKLEHVYIPQLRIALSTYDFYTHFGGAESVDLDAYISFTTDFGECWGHASSLMQRAVDAFGEARLSHSILEKIYVPAMHFDAMEEKGDALIRSIFK
ncbi:MAG: hypothetical protein PUB07_01100 [Clostridia bacterium]|nr:hypothetical protein [Clostridia bacterium]